MRRLRAGLVRFAGLFGKTHRDRELDAEIESVIQFHVDDKVRAGMTPGQARREALLEALGPPGETACATRPGRRPSCESR